MKISLEWLREYVELPADVDADKLMHDLTLATVEVEGVEYPDQRLAKVVVARVLSAQPVDGTSLTATTCDAGGEPLSVVCGANNVRAGMTVALALPGAEIVPKGKGEVLTVGEVELRGIPSQAVICAANEIGLTGVFPIEDEQSIIDLHELAEMPSGTPLGQALGFDDAVFEIDNKSLTNRPDLWGHYGIARELAAIYGTNLAPLPSVDLPESSDGLLAPSDTSFCNRFTATVIEQVETTPAPLWMRSRLARLGQRSIDLFVDLTNYVMFVTGQPSHAYDRDQLHLPMTARKGHGDEQVTLLDDSVHAAHENLGFIADSAQLLAVAGVMGGAASAVTRTTKNIFLEMANFDAQAVRRASLHVNVRTDASSRFEKAIDSQRIDEGVAVFVSLLQHIQPGARVTAYQDWTHATTQRAEVEVGEAFINVRLGKRFAPDAVSASLEKLGFSVGYDDGVYRLVAPTWRSTGDISLPADIVEEVARLHGYDNFTFVPPRVDLYQVERDRRLPLDRRVREVCAKAGLQEVFTYPWTRAPLLAVSGAATDQLLELSAPPSPELSHLRNALAPNLLEAIASNQRYFNQFGLFEVGAVFTSDREHLSVAGALVGDDPAQLFAQAKGIVTAIGRHAHLQQLSFADTTPPGWAEADAVLGVASDDQPIGALAIANNRIKRTAGIKRGEVALFEFDLDALQSYPTRENVFAPTPEYPHVELDVSLELANAVHWSDVSDACRRVDTLVRDVAYIGEYRGKGIADGARSLTFRLILGADDRTLVAEEAEQVRERLVANLVGEFQASRR